MKKNNFKIFSITVFVIVMIMLIIIAVPLVKNINNPEAFERYINDLGAFGFVMMFFIQIAQIIVALIPGEVVEFVAGTLYGWFGGLVFCSVGIVIGQSIVFKAVRYFGKDFVKKVAGSKMMNKFRFLQDEKKLKTILFLLFFIPGTPKDLLTYIVPMTKISFRDFIVITLLARIPSVVSSTYAGSAFAEHDHKMMIVVYLGIGVFSLIGVMVYRLLDLKLEKYLKEKKGDN